MSVSQIRLILAGIAVVAGLAASSALATPPAHDGLLIAMVNIATAADTAGQGWFGG